MFLTMRPTRRLLNKIVYPSESVLMQGLPPIVNENTAVTAGNTQQLAAETLHHHNHSNSGGDGGGSKKQQRQTTNAATPLPKRIILLRHGESLGNVDETSYGHIPDWKIPLTRRGERQALKAAKDLQQLLKQDGAEMESLFTYCSPYKRTAETWEIMKDYLEEQIQAEQQQQQQQQVKNDNGNEEQKNDTSSSSTTSTTTAIELIGTREEPRIAEQQFGNFQNPHKVRTAKAERRTFGRFFFRFPNGEAGLDVYNRVSSFWATVSRDLLQLQDALDDDDMETLNILIVTHGLTLRLLLMRYFQLSVEEFEASWNSQNAKLVVMERKFSPHTNKEYFQLQEQAKEALNLKGDISNNLPVYWRGDALDQKPYDRED